jgi:hypothetical protein
MARDRTERTAATPPPLSGRGDAGLSIGPIRAYGAVVRRSIVVAGAFVLLLSGCGLQVPVDPDGTLDRVRDGELRVGLTADSPAEEVLVEGFAEQVGAEVSWREGGEEQLMTALEDGELDLVIGGLTDASPWSTHAAITRPYAETVDDRGRTVRHVMAAPLGENAFLVELETYLEDAAS